MMEMEKYPLLKSFLKEKENPYVFIEKVFELEQEIKSLKLDQKLKKSIKFILCQSKNKEDIPFANLHEKLGISKFQITKLEPIRTYRGVPVNLDIVLKIFSMDKRYVESSLFKEEYFNKIFQ